jgi:hypothetical protein
MIYKVRWDKVEKVVLHHFTLQSDILCEIYSNLDELYQKYVLNEWNHTILLWIKKTPVWMRHIKYV